MAKQGAFFSFEELLAYNGYLPPHLCINVCPDNLFLYETAAR